MTDITNDLDRGVIDTAVRDGTAAGKRMASYWLELEQARIPPNIAAGLIMQYQAAMLCHLLPMPVQAIDVTHHAPYEDDGY